MMRKGEEEEVSQRISKSSCNVVALSIGSSCPTNTIISSSLPPLSLSAILFIFIYYFSTFSIKEEEEERKRKRKRKKKERKKDKQVCRNDSWGQLRKSKHKKSSFFFRTAENRQSLLS